MRKSVEKSGKTVEEAINLALEELGLEREKAEIQIIDEGAKGLFGIIGSKVAKVVVTEKDTAQSRAKEFLENVFEKMNLKVTIHFLEKESSLKIILEGDDMGILIGRRGETLDSLQYLTSLVVNRGDHEYIRVSMDTENYRKKREETLIRLAKRLADRVLKYRRSITLEPMNPYERRIIHSTLQNNKMVTTYSVGDEPNRKVVIALNSRKKIEV
ncbi:RNA-binding cell elongation regulator Jag/EloR [Petroclostridium sp. X23]|uniref:RNA-binding cell elongation regulator Jag/EloR n=1 Tax=Petroclostridium sp. X23 TaxID=3045146 RepID=UPI0024ADE0E3|nr:RNA-binding cell elongation regulator Jag/EloR [Petroclostridium sp. X23]WHH57252.1 RNA-binding cell elongation regulator Jag/EloR [Petroclostridium sp. X23]